MVESATSAARTVEGHRGSLLVERDDVDETVAILTLNRPERLNALSLDLVRELRETVQRLDSDTSVRAIVLTGAGRAFSAGADLRAGPSDAEEVLREFYNPLIRALMDLRKPSIAAINGIAAGAGLSLCLACDLRVASASTTFQMAFVKVGLVPDAGATWLLPRAIGSARASDMALSGRSVTSAEGLAWGLVNQVAPQGDALAQSVELARRLAALSSTTGAIARLLRDGAARTLDEQLDAESTAQGLAQRGPDYSEAKQAFAEKRTPEFRRR